MDKAQFDWFLQTWLLSAQVFSTREFAQLAVNRLLPKVAPWFTIVLLPFGFALDGTFLNFNISVGVMGILYTTVYILRTKPWERVGFAVTVFLSLLGMKLWQLGSTPRVWICAGALVALIASISWILERFSGVVRLSLASILSLLVEVALSASFGHQLGDVAVAGMTAFMSGMYVTFRARHDKFVEETHEAVQYDALTNALTRRGLQTWLEECRTECRTEGVIVFCDLDNFKWINDMWGHEVGDHVLQEFVRRIRVGLRASDVIARFGGDEYQIWIPLSTPNSAEQIVERLHTLATEGEYRVLPGDNGLKIGISMGWTYGELNDMTANEADFALLAAKKSGKNRFMRASSGDILADSAPDERDLNPHLYWLTNIASSLWKESHYPFVLTDKGGRILVANEAYETLVGRKLAELKGAKPSINSAQKTPMKVYQNMWNNLANGKPWSGCLLNRREDGTEWWEVSELFPVILSGQIIGYWGMVQELENAKFPHTPNRNNYSWDGEIDWAFQPIIDTEAQAVIGYEALARPQWGTESVGPDTFFRIAERFDFSSQADWDCLESLLERLKDVVWPNGCRLFLNVYAATLRDTARIGNWLQRLYEVHPNIVCVFEILEHHVEAIDVDSWNAFQHDFPLVELAQDDFGVGERDLARLTKVKPQWVKLDRMWVEMLATRPESQKLIASIANWASSEGIHVIIEGIETLEQCTAYTHLGIQHEQGYFWSKPQKEPNFVPQFEPMEV